MCTPSLPSNILNFSPLLIFNIFLVTFLSPSSNILGTFRYLEYHLKDQRDFLMLQKMFKAQECYSKGLKMTPGNIFNIVNRRIINTIIKTFRNLPPKSNYTTKSKAARSSPNAKTTFQHQRSLHLTARTNIFAPSKKSPHILNVVHTCELSCRIHS